MDARRSHMHPSTMRPARLRLRAARRATSISIAVVAAIAAIAPAGAQAGTFGTDPLAISVGPNGEAPNGASGGPAVSGDNRVARYAAFHSDASNLVSADANGTRDVFVWSRPTGLQGLALNQLGAGTVIRASVNSAEREANGMSQAPSLDGSLKRAPHCVAFQSRATNLSHYDRRPDWDIYVRDIRRGTTRLVSRGVRGDATDPSIDGNCYRVAFQTRAHVWIGRASGSERAVRFRTGENPDYSLDGRAITWQRNRVVYARRLGDTLRIGSGRNPVISDRAEGGWAVGYESDSHVRLAVFGTGSRVRRSTVSGPDSVLAGVTAYAADRGIITYATGAVLYYENRNTGNYDDLAYANSKINEAYASARANFVAFTATGGRQFVGDPRNGVPIVYFKHLIDGETR